MDPLPLDDDGLLPLPAFEQASTGLGFRVFAQLPDALIDIQAWDRHATRFFDAHVRLTRPKRYGPVAPRFDGAHVLVEARDRPLWVQSVFLRPRTDEDLASAHAAEGGGGLALLAQRCSMVALVPVDGSRERDSLFVAALLASVLLGPLLSPDGAHIFGARTARERFLAV